MKKPAHNPAIIDHAGSGKLIDRYNINDKAHEESSVDDFVETTSAFRHADGKIPEPSPDDLAPDQPK
jgi:hypothetical protein